jgi:hypothetical protein
MDKKIKKTSATSEVATLLRTLNLQPIAFQPIYKMVTGSFSGGILLSQIMYWYSRVNRPFYKTDEDFARELYMTIKEFRTAKSKLDNVPFVKTYRKGVPAKTHYEVSYDLYFSTMKQIVGRLPQMGQSLDAQMGGTCLSQMGQTITESTTETTTDIKTSSSEDKPPTEENEESGNKSQRPIEEGKATIPPSSATPPLPQEAVSLAKRLGEHVLGLDGKSKNLTPPKYNKTINSWAGDIDKLNRLDGREWGEITKVLLWAVGDDFWNTNILSGSKFRSQFSTLVIKAASPGSKGSEPVLIGYGRD